MQLVNSSLVGAHGQIAQLRYSLPIFTAASSLYSELLNFSLFLVLVAQSCSVSVRSSACVQLRASVRQNSCAFLISASYRAPLLRLFGYSSYSGMYDLADSLETVAQRVKSQSAWRLAVIKMIG